MGGKIEECRAMLAYHSDNAMKAAILVELAEIRRVGKLVKAQSLADGTSRDVNRALKIASYAEYEARFGIPQSLAHLADSVVEDLPDELAETWLERFMGAARPGADLSRVVWKFLHRVLTDTAITPGISDERVAPQVAIVSDIVRRKGNGDSVCRGELEAAIAGVLTSATACQSAAKAALSTTEVTSVEVAEAAASAASAAISAAMAAGAGSPEAQAAGVTAAAEAAAEVSSPFLATVWASGPVIKHRYVLMSDVLIELMQAA